ncbi:hypothetical protein IQ07DRAFT_643716 [Pyrenochaeta sp. DS3sAY3a]|nr:hypothetical protein IQ07DRAFT_643716 [Pyrenochaeta sp. DS3sAY3a]
MLELEPRAQMHQKQYIHALSYFDTNECLCIELAKNNLQDCSLDSYFVAKNCILIAGAVDDDHETEVWFLKAQNAYCGPYPHYEFESEQNYFGFSAVLGELWTVLDELHEEMREDGTDISIRSMTEPGGEEDGLEKYISEGNTNEKDTGEEVTSAEHSNEEDMMSEDKVNEDNVTEDATGTNMAESNQPSQDYEDFLDNFLQLVRNHTQHREETRLNPHSPSQHHHENEPPRHSPGQSRPMTMKMTFTIENHHREIQILYRD